MASATGTSGLDLTWQVQDGDYRVVLMNADGAAGVQSQLGVGLGLSGMFGLALGLLIGGAVLIVLAIALLVFTRPRLGRPAYQGGYGPPPGPGNGAPAGYGTAAAYPPQSGTLQTGIQQPAGNAPRYAPPTGTPMAPHSPPLGTPIAPPAGYAPPAGDGPAGPLPPVDPTPPVREPLP